MSTKIVNIKGFAKNKEQFVIKTEQHEVRISNNQNHPKLDAPSPIEYILAGYAGCINAVGTKVATELNINLKSLEIEISGTINIDKFLGKPTLERAGFNTIDVTVKPISNATKEELQYWLAVVESRCPVYDNLVNQTPINVNLLQLLEIAQAN